ncbi:MAG: type II toxin-antitoxin system HicA family toxin [Candidatus Micrarchaeales archaeon]|nr:type II toxin-antitoxin system HicA family toxin [Candidatus Micrarchaeales archaeon]
MTKRIPVTSYIVVKVLQGKGFVILRRSGSHLRLKHPDGRITTVPIHGKEAIGTGLLFRILKDVDVSKEEFDRLSREI